MSILNDAIAKARSTAREQYLKQALRIAKAWEIQLTELSKVIDQKDGKWCVFSEDRSKTLGCYDTKKEAVERLRQIEGHKKCAEDFLGKMEAKDVEATLFDTPLSAAISLRDTLRKLQECDFEGNVDGLLGGVVEFIDLFKGNNPTDSMDREQLVAARERRSKEYGIEVLEEGSNLTFPKGYPTDLAAFSDPVNIKYPVDTEAHARNARARFKQHADAYKKTESKRVIHERIVRAELKMGIKVTIDPDDSLDKLLPQSLRDQAERDAAKKGMPDQSLEGGIHLHRLVRENSNTKTDGAHHHIFLVRRAVEEVIDGVKQPAYDRDLVLYSDEDGMHGHSLPNDAANNTNIDGEHFHKVMFFEEFRDADGYLDWREIELETTEDGAHVHQLQISTTAFDGLHVHQLELPDGKTVASMTPGDVWKDLYDSPPQKDFPPLPPSIIFAGLSDQQYGALRAMEGMATKADKEPTVIQTLIFSKDEFDSEDSAKKWAKDHDYKSSKVDETENSYRLRQKEPSDFEEGSFKTITLTDGVKAVIGNLKKADTEKVDFTKETLPALKMPDPKFIVKRLQLQMPAGLLSTQERRKRLGKNQVLVNELAPLEFDASFAWGIVQQDEPQKFDSFKSIPADLVDGLDPYTRKEFSVLEEVVYFLPLKLIKAFDLPLKLNNTPLGRRLAGKVNLAKDTIKISKCQKCENPFENPDGLFSFCTECRGNETKVTKALAKGLHVKVVKTEEIAEERIIFGAVLVPDETDAQGDIYSAEEVKKACYSYMEIYGGQHKIMHQGEALGKKVSLLENYLSKFAEDWNGDKYPAGTWFQGVRANDDEIWKAAKSGELTGWSIGGTAIRESLA